MENASEAPENIAYLYFDGLSRLEVPMTTFDGFTKRVFYGTSDRARSNQNRKAFLGNTRGYS